MQVGPSPTMTGCSSHRRSSDGQHATRRRAREAETAHRDSKARSCTTTTRSCRRNSAACQRKPPANFEDPAWRYHRARFYDPSTGRFNRLDPFAGNFEDPLSLHKYLYTHADPINMTDPSGEIALLTILGIGALIGGIAGGIGGAYYGAQQSGDWLSFETFKYGVVGVVGGAAAGAFLGGAGHILITQGVGGLATVLTRGFTATTRKFLVAHHFKTEAAFGLGYALGFAYGVIAPDAIVGISAASTAGALSGTDAIIRAARMQIHPLIKGAVAPFFVRNAPRLLTMIQSGTFIGLGASAGFAFGHLTGSALGYALQAWDES